MAVGLGSRGIRANAILPGHIVTENIQKTWDAEPEKLQFFVDQYPVGRVGDPRDIANAVRFLCSDDASFITGHALAVDGGLSIQLQEDFGVRQAAFLQANPKVLAKL
jgi:NAD(P)-dependent dehydrogenase (short-subunit alcohol dehydrogenase family)